jgi:hypothetical protein
MKISLFILLAFITSSISFADDGYSEFKSIIQTNKNFRDEIINRSAEVDLVLTKGHILTGSELESINRMAMARFEHQENSLLFIDQHSVLVHRKVPRSFTPTPEELKSVMMALALGVTMADNYLMVYKVFHTNTKLRRLLNEYDQSYDKKLNMMRDSIHEFYSLKNRKRLKRAIKLYERFFTAELDEYEDPEFIYLSSLINSSAFYQEFSERNVWSGVKDLLSYLGKKMFHLKLYASDIGTKLIGKVIYDGSQIFGNTLGTIQFRPGRLKTSSTFIPRMTSQLKVLDVLLERTPARATSNFIPGFWTHAAIYVGTETDLKNYGIWDHPLVQPHQKRIRNGASVIEALRSGVEINPLENFKEADTVSTLRLKIPLTNEQIKTNLLAAFAQLGKVYDFSFDIQSGEKIVCSELHYITFTDVPFNTSRIFGRQTISVDQVAEQGLTNRYFEVVNFWLDGKEMEDDIAIRYDITLLTQGRTILTDEEQAYFSDIYDLETGKIRQRKRANPVPVNFKMFGT